MTMPKVKRNDTNKDVLVTQPQIVEERKLESRMATEAQITMNLMSGGLGAGIFSIPWTTAGTSLMPALVVIAGVLIVNAWTVMILVEAAERTKTFDLGGLLSHLPGRTGQAAQALGNSFIWMTSFICLVAYFVVVTDSIAPFTVGTKFHSRFFQVCLCAVVVMPLTFLNQRKLSCTSLLVISVNIYIVLLLGDLFFADSPPHPDICILGFSKGAIAMMSGVSQAIIVQLCVLPMYGQLEDRSPEKFHRIVTVSFSLLYFFFSAYAILAYWTFGPTVRGNIIQNLPLSRLGIAARLASAVSVLGVFPIIMLPMVASIESSGWPFKQAIIQRYGLAVLARFAIVAFVTLAAFCVEHLGFINVVNGAMSLGVFTAACPSLVGYYLLGKHGLSSKCSMLSLLFFGILASALGLFFSDNYARDLELPGRCFVSSYS